MSCVNCTKFQYSLNLPLCLRKWYSRLESANLALSNFTYGFVSRLKLRKVLVLHKKSTFQLQAVEYREGRFVKLLEQGHEVVTSVKLAHSEHMYTLESLIARLEKLGIEYTVVARSALTEIIRDVDLLISVGGDGTFLDAAHFLEDVPIVGVNSSRSSSFGHLCLATEKNFDKVLEDIESDSLTTSKLTRLEMRLNGNLMPHLALNELLVAHSHPAATARYFIELGDEKEEQRSSGVWIATATGSTGSLRSAGGTVLPITDRRYQYLVREPFARPKEYLKLVKGILKHNESIKLVSQMRTGAIFIDGQHINCQFYLGDELLVKPSLRFLNAYVSEKLNDIFLEGCC